MYNSDREKYLAEVAARRFQEELDAQNRCNRCDRPLSDPTADYGWRCAEILGVNRGNPLTEHFFGQGIYADDNKQALDNFVQYAYNEYRKSNFTSKEKNKSTQAFAQISSSDLSSRYMLKNQNNTSKLYGLLYYPANKYMEKVEQTRLPEPLGKDERGEFVYEQHDPRNYLPSVIDAAAVARHIYAIPSQKSVLTYNNEIPPILKNNWELFNVIEGKEGMRCGIYVKKMNYSTSVPEYFIVFKGTSPEKFNDWKNNIQRATSFYSSDMWDAIMYSTKFVKDIGNAKVTFVGHSKGGAEAAAAAVATNRDAILFNPANTNLKDYGLDGSKYTGNMVQYVMENEILSSTGIGPISPTKIPTIRTAFIKHDGYSPVTLTEQLNNHSMETIIGEFEKEKRNEK